MEIPRNTRLEKGDYSLDGPALVLGKKLERYPNAAKAKAMHMRDQFPLIVLDASDLRRIPEAIIMGFVRGDVEFLETDEDYEAAWQCLINQSELYDPWSKQQETTGEPRRTRTSDTTIYKFDSAAAANFQGPKQAKILAIELSQEFESCTQEQLEKFLVRIAAKGILKTKQPAERIFAYYRKDLIAAKVLTIRQ